MSGCVSYEGVVLLQAFINVDQSVLTQIQNVSVIVTIATATELTPPTFFILRVGWPDHFLLRIGLGCPDHYCVKVEWPGHRCLQISFQ